MQLDDVLLESGQRERVVARQLAREIHQNVQDLTEIIRSGSRIAAGNPHYVQGLRDDISRLYTELLDLGFEYDPQSPDFMRPLTLDEASKGQRDRERRARAERERADQIANARAKKEIEDTMASAQRAIRQARVNRQLDPTRQFAPKPEEPEAYTFGGVTVPIERTEPEPEGGNYVLFRIIPDPERPSIMAYWLHDRDAEVQLRDGSRGYQSAVRLRQNAVVKGTGYMANLLEQLRLRGAVQVIFDREISRKYPEFTSKIKYYIDHNMDDYVNYETQR